MKRKSESRVELSTCDQLPPLSICIHDMYIIDRVSNFALLLLLLLLSLIRSKKKSRVRLVQCTFVYYSLFFSSLLFSPPVFLSSVVFQVSQKSGIWEGANFSAAGGAEGPSRSVSHAASLDAISRRAVKPDTARVPCRSLTCSVCK